MNRAMQTPAPAGTKRRANADSPGGRPAIVAAGLSKTFRIPRHAPSTFKERAVHPFRRNPVEELRAVRDISFEVAEGEFFGIIGPNGSGKSTLLKLMAGIYRPDAGTVMIEGRISPFIELGVGFNLELAARDNVMLNCALLGLSRAEAKRRFEEVIDFAELDEFVDLKLKNYSSGMHVRLAFATAIQVDADVLLLDEVLAVGDASFQEKCFDTFLRLKSEGKTIILVSHGLPQIERFCDRAMLLERGEAVTIGEPSNVVTRYRERIVYGGDQSWGRENRFGDGSAEIVEAWFEGPAGERIESSRQGDQLTFRAEIVFHRAMEKPTLGLALRSERGEVALAITTEWDEVETPSFAGGDRAALSISFENALGVGRYFASPMVSYRHAIALADMRENVTSLTVEGPVFTGAVTNFPHETRVERL